MFMFDTAQDISDEKTYGKDQFAIQGKRIKELIKSFKVVHLMQRGEEITEGPVIFTDSMFNKKESFEKVGVEDAMNRFLKDEAAYAPTRRTVVVGEVYAMFNATGVAVPLSREPIVCVSAAGLNFKARGFDIREFISNDTLLDTEAKYTEHVRRWSPEERTSRLKKIVCAMADLWYLILKTMAEGRVSYPCLSALGCGSFMGNIHAVPEWWAAALAAVLSKFSFDNIQAVIMCTPLLCGDNRSVLTVKAFHAMLENVQQKLRVPVVQMHQHDVLDVAYALSVNGLRAGVLNPSDPTAVRAGYLGMFWDDGNCRVEELLALRTTLLLGHRDVAQSLWQNDK